LQKRAFLDGVKTMIATSPGNFAWGFVVGLGMINLGLTTAQGLSFGFLVYSGSAQMVAMPLMGAGAAISLVLLAGFMACIRFVIYSAAMAPALHHLPLGKRLFIGAFSIDAAIGFFLTRRQQSGKGKPLFVNRIAFLMGMNGIIWGAWTSGIVVGILAAGALPASPKFTYLGIVALLGITVALIQSRAGLACALASAAVSLLLNHWPYQLGLLAAIIVGVATGYSLSIRQLSRQLSSTP
jgi:predicted branched-subunit amino acid permease